MHQILAGDAKYQSWSVSNIKHYVVTRLTAKPFSCLKIRLNEAGIACIAYKVKRLCVAIFS